MRGLPALLLLLASLVAGCAVPADPEPRPGPQAMAGPDCPVTAPRPASGADLAALLGLTELEGMRQMVPGDTMYDGAVQAGPFASFPVQAEGEELEAFLRHRCAGIMPFFSRAVAYHRNYLHAEAWTPGRGGISLAVGAFEYPSAEEAQVAWRGAVERCGIQPEGDRSEVAQFYLSGGPFRAVLDAQAEGQPEALRAMLRDALAHIEAQGTLQACGTP